MWQAIAAWLPMVAIAIASGLAREAWLVLPLGEARAHQWSTLTLIVLLGLYIRMWVRLRPPADRRAALGVGLVWMLLTLALEFGVGRYVAGRPWSELLADYDLLAGRLWLLVPLWIVIAPVVFLPARADPG